MVVKEAMKNKQTFPLISTGVCVCVRAHARAPKWDLSVPWQNVWIYFCFALSVLISNWKYEIWKYDLQVLCVYDFSSYCSFGSYYELCVACLHSQPFPQLIWRKAQCILGYFLGIRVLGQEELKLCEGKEDQIFSADQIETMYSL